MFHQYFSNKKIAAEIDQANIHLTRRSVTRACRLVDLHRAIKFILMISLR